MDHNRLCCAKNRATNLPSLSESCLASHSMARCPTSSPPSGRRRKRQRAAPTTQLSRTTQQSPTTPTMLLSNVNIINNKDQTQTYSYSTFDTTLPSIKIEHRELELNIGCNIEDTYTAASTQESSYSWDFSGDNFDFEHIELELGLESTSYDSNDNFVDLCLKELITS
eukprot:m.129602 g.129602  ORF g.129602 m.129602 type:complete len:168 (+) comp29409_c5_seq1:1972-2475(+)